MGVPKPGFVLSHRGCGEQMDLTGSEHEQSLLKKAKRKIIGAPRDVSEPSIFHKLSLIPFLAWIGLGSDGLSSSSYGPEEAFKALWRKMAIDPNTGLYREFLTKAEEAEDRRQDPLAVAQVDVGLSGLRPTVVHMTIPRMIGLLIGTLVAIAMAIGLALGIVE